MSAGVRVDLTLTKQETETKFICNLAPCNSEAILHVPQQLSGVIGRCSSLTLISPTISCIETRVHVTAKLGGESRIFCHPSKLRGELRCAELFGGLGGWSYAMDMWKVRPLVIVESDPITAATCARNVNAIVLSIEEFLDHAMKGQVTDTVVVCGDAGDTRLWMGMSLLNVAFILSSPPCQSWSTVGASGGLNSIDGAIFVTTLKNAGMCRVHAYTAENVPGLPRHCDFHQLITEAAMSGMRLVVQGVFKCQRVLPLCRDRWLATFIHVSIPVDPPLIHRASSLSFICPEFQCPEPGPNLASAEALFQQVPEDHRVVLSPDDAAMNMMCQAKYLPKTWTAPANPSDPQSVLVSRCIASDSKLSGVMARYGSQHTLPAEHFESKGLYTVLFNDHGSVRYFSPWEIIAALGFPPTVALDATLEGAYRQTGNAISIAHAWLQIAKTHILLDHLSPFHIEKSFMECVKDLQKQATKLTGMTPAVVDKFCILVPAAEAIETHVHEPAGKKMKTEPIPPMAPFVAEQVAVVTAPLPFDPDFHAEDSVSNGSKHAFAKGGIMFFRHAQKNWMSFSHGDTFEKVGEMIMRILPHARPHHFESLKCDASSLEWGSFIKCAPPAYIQFQPNLFQVSCQFQDKSQVMMKADVTWTVETALSFLASQIRCNVNSLVLHQSTIMAKPCDFLAEYEAHEFQVGFKLFMPGYVSFMPCETDAKTAIEPVTPGSKRFVACHPQAKLTRTVAVDNSAPVAEVAKRLFPNLTASIAWSLMAGGVVLEPGTPVADVNAFTIDWHSYRPLAPTEVECTCCTAPIDSAAMQVNNTFQPQRWIRSPFSCKPNIARVNDSLTVKQAAASYVAFSNADLTVMCMNGSVIIDPNECFGNISGNSVIAFKVSPLKGGGKQHVDQLKTKVKHVLEQHGVTKEASQNRADMFIAKADEETLGKAVNADDISFWQAMKDEANRVHFRLVYRNELNAKKQEGRSKPPDRNGRKTPKNAREPKDAFVAHPSNIKVDFTHFKCEDEVVEQIDGARFGPDQTGMAVMTCKEADRLSQSYPSNISVEPLAILVVGRSFAHNRRCLHPTGLWC